MYRYKRLPMIATVTLLGLAACLGQPVSNGVEQGGGSSVTITEEDSSRISPLAIASPDQLQGIFQDIYQNDLIPAPLTQEARGQITGSSLLLVMNLNGRDAICNGVLVQNFHSILTLKQCFQGAESSTVGLKVQDNNGGVAAGSSLEFIDDSELVRVHLDSGGTLEAGGVKTGRASELQVGAPLYVGYYEQTGSSSVKFVMEPAYYLGGTRGANSVFDQLTDRDPDSEREFLITTRNPIPKTGVGSGIFDGDGTLQGLLVGSQQVQLSYTSITEGTQGTAPLPVSLGLKVSP